LTVKSYTSQAGLSMVGLILTLTLISFIIMSVSLFLMPLSKQRLYEHENDTAMAIAQSILEEIWLKRFDERQGHIEDPRCQTSQNNPSMPCSTILGSEPTDTFRNDVDDYHNLNEKNLITGTSHRYEEVYPQFQIKVHIQYCNALGIKRNRVTDFKHIQVQVTTPHEQKVILEGIKGNY
tara:strand:+ start:617 stop:1153 length:537 start_codon:yes stop_codon:yes gene_type:complete